MPALFLYTKIMIKIKNKDYKFKFGFKAILFFEEESGKSISELGDNIKMADVISIAYCGLKASGEKVTKDFIIDAIDDDMSLLNVFTEAMSKDMAAMNNLKVEAKK